MFEQKFCIRFSRKILWLEVATTNNDPYVVAHFYLRAVLKLAGMLFAQLPSTYVLCYKRECYNYNCCHYNMLNWDQVCIFCSMCASLAHLQCMVALKGVPHLSELTVALKMLLLLYAKWCYDMSIQTPMQGNIVFCLEALSETL